MKILVSIINWNNNTATNACLKSIGLIDVDEQPDVLLIDNNSQQEPIHVKSSVTSRLRSLKIIKNPQNFGFATAHNSSLETAMKESYDYVVLLNNDTELVDLDIFKRLTLELEHTEALAAAPTILSQKQPPLMWYGGGRLDTIIGSTKHFGVGKTPDKNVQTRTVSFLTGCCLAIDVNMLRKFGVMLPENYFLYWEDADWCAQAREAGYSLLYVPSATILHNVSSSLGMRSPSYTYYNIRNKLLFIRRRVPTFLIPLAVVHTCYISIKYSLLFLLHPQRNLTKSFRALCFAWIDGCRNKSGKVARPL